MEVEPGKMKLAKPFAGPEAVNCNETPAVVTLQSGRTEQYPRLVVMPQLELQVDDWAKADPERFGLSWPAFRLAAGGPVTYEVEMVLSGPCEVTMSPEHMQAIRATRETVTGTRWPVGEKGVGGQKLGPGNIYLFGLLARDEKGNVVSRAVRKRLWTPWGSRESRPPYTDSDTYRQSPIQVETYYRSSASYGDGRSESLDEKMERFPRDYPDAFELEYVQVGKAWLDWTRGKQDEARGQLEKLVKSIPEGSVPQATAVWLLQALENGEAAPKRLKLAAPRLD
jgi:hypothetical protein